ncbi:hypothetical protein ACFW04_014660 [Cataglyphis niger]
MREAISPRDRLSAILRYLATGNTFQDLAYSIRIAPNTLSQIVHETVQATIKVFEEKVMVFPSISEEWELIADKYQTNWQIPHCIGGSIYRNYKEDNSIILLALVDTEYKFIFVDIDWNGRMHDSAFLHKMPYVIVGDDAFSLTQNLMKSYPNRKLTIEKRIFNYRLSRARRVVENAFGILVNSETFLDSGLVSISQQCGNRCIDLARMVRDNFTEYFKTVEIVNWQYDAIAKGNV